MSRKSPNAYLSVVFLTLFTVTGCNQASEATRIDSSRPAWSVENPDTMRNGQQDEAPNWGTSRHNPTSSLDALQQGRSPATPPSSPVKEVYFDFDSAELRSDALEILKINAEWLKNHPSVRIEVEGHCDDRGTNEYNMALGAKRAQSARNYLTVLGIARSRMSTISFGEEVPVCTDTSDECRQNNRRARFVIIETRPSG